MAGRKLLIHLSDRDKWGSALAVIDRLMADSAGNDMQITIIADMFAGAVCIACNRHLKQQMIDFVAAGQCIVVCEASIRCLNIALDSLPDFVKTVPVALLEIVKLHEDGFHYIKL